MAVTYFTGYEAGTFGDSKVAALQGTTAGNSNATVVAGARTGNSIGAFVGQINCTASVNSLITHAYNGGTGVGVCVGRAWVRFTLLPTLNGQYVGEFNGTLAAGSSFRFFFRTGTNDLVVGNGTSGTMPALVTPWSVGAVTLNQWYRFDWRVDMTANPHVMTWSVDGVAQTTINFAQAASTCQAVFWGAFNATPMTMQVDDLALSFVSADYPIGDSGGCAYIRPTTLDITNIATGAFKNQSAVAVAATDVAQINEAAPLTGTTTWISQTVATTTTTGFLRAAGFSVPGSVSSITRANFIVAANSTGTLANSWSAKSTVGGSLTTFASAVTTNATTQQFWRGQRNDLTPANVGAATIDFGFATDVVPVPQWQAVGIEYEAGLSGAAAAAPMRRVGKMVF